MANRYTARKRRELECLGACVGREFYMELWGGTPLLRSRREIVVRGKVVGVKEFNVDEKTITIEIPLIHLSTLSKEPIKPIKRKRSKKAKR